METLFSDITKPKYSIYVFYQGFKETSVHSESCLSRISGFDTYVVKALMDVQLSEVSCSVQLQNKLEDEG